jgi:hypothetical protein
MPFSQVKLHRHEPNYPSSHPPEHDVHTQHAQNPAHSHAHVSAEALRVGDVVTIAHTSKLRNNQPVQPFVSRIRNDLTWEDVLRNAIADQFDFWGELIKRDKRNEKHINFY